MTVIDVGQDCSNLGDSLSANYTLIVKNNPANAGGTIDYVCLYSSTALIGIEFASFADEGSLAFSTNGNVSVADQSSAGLSEYNAPGDFTAFNINPGEYIGVYMVGGKISTYSSGGSGLWYKIGDNIPASSITFISYNNVYRLSLYATGETSPTPKSSTDTLSPTITQDTQSIRVITDGSIVGVLTSGYSITAQVSSAITPVLSSSVSIEAALSAISTISPALDFATPVIILSGSDTNTAIITTVGHVKNNVSDTDTLSPSLSETVRPMTLKASSLIEAILSSSFTIAADVFATSTVTPIIQTTTPEVDLSVSDTVTPVFSSIYDLTVLLTELNWLASGVWENKAHPFMFRKLPGGTWASVMVKSRRASGEWQ